MSMMNTNSGIAPRHAKGNSTAALGLYRLLDPEVLADPYPLYHQLQAESDRRRCAHLHEREQSLRARLLSVQSRVILSRF